MKFEQFERITRSPSATGMGERSLSIARMDCYVFGAPPVSSAKPRSNQDSACGENLSTRLALQILSILLPNQKNFRDI